MAEITLKVLNPRAEVEKAPEINASPRLNDLAGRKIALLKNGKSGAELLHPYLEDALKQSIPGVKLQTWLVPLSRTPEEKAPILKEIADYADGVIALIGD
ncbi:MAG: hypothetical protein Q7R57_03075 [Dehalococcoidales bacterium]|nr:hypothetical protein [Dehalococcoidales bacterium]